jgi:hypothetical protein
MLRTIARPALLMLLVVASVAPARDGEKGAAQFSFAMIGDTPYGSGPFSSGDEVKFQRVIDEINDDHQVSWVLHTGDIKTGSSLDTDQLIRARFDLYQKFNAPFIFTPGDNEWTDAHRPAEGMYNPLERLAFLRKVFFPNPGWTTGGRPMRVATQAADPGFGTFVENSMWVRSSVVFASIHVVGSNDDLNPWAGLGFATVQTEQQAEFDARRAANLAWIDKAFALAHQIQARGVFVFMQADPGFELARGATNRKVFDPILDRLFDKTVAFGKPVMLGHGDSHYFRLDKPGTDLAGLRIENFNRLENFGETEVHWVKVTVDPNSRSVFSVEPMIVPGNTFAH